MFRKKEKEKGNKAKGHMPVQALYLRGNKRQAKHPPSHSRIYEDARRPSYMGARQQQASKQGIAPAGLLLLCCLVLVYGIAPTDYHIGTSILLSLLRLGLVVHSIWDRPTHSISIISISSRSAEIKGVCILPSSRSIPLNYI